MNNIFYKCLLYMFNKFCPLLFNIGYHFGDKSESFIKGFSKFLEKKLFTQGNYESFLKNYPTISDAPDGEDIIIYKFLHNIQDSGFYIDVGAAHPIKNSVTKFFYDRGWSGINIDSRYDVMQLYKKIRPRDINCCAAISNVECELPFWESEGLSTLDFETVMRLGETKFKKTFIKTTLLKNLLSNYSLNDIHFLKIDVETHEKNVLLGMDFEKYRPWLIIVESTLPNTMIPCHDEWESILYENNYLFVTSYSVNRYYIANEKKDLLLNNFMSLPLTPYLMRKHFNILYRLHSPISFYKNLQNKK